VQNTFINQNSDVFLGYIAWAAGSFSTSYTLSLTPTKQNGKYVDNALASRCVISPWLNAATVTVTPSAILTGAAGSVTSSARGSTTTGMGTSTSTSASIRKDTGIGASGSTQPSKMPSVTSGTSTAGLTSSGARITKLGSGLMAASILLASYFTKF
jgi:endoglucanase